MEPVIAAYRNRRGARLRFRPVGGPFDRYPHWLRALKGHSGVYIIREYERRGPRVVYVGESHSDRLYGTFTRHFQNWRRARGKNGGHYAASLHDPGLAFPRERCDAAAMITPAERAIEIQNAFIAWLRPRDNIVGKPDDDDDFVSSSSLIHADEEIPF